MSRLFSPYEINPANINPLRDILEESVDFEALKRSEIKLFVNATNVRTGLPRVFRNDELSADAVLASACLPMLHQAIHDKTARTVVIALPPGDRQPVRVASGDGSPDGHPTTPPTNHDRNEGSR